MKRWGRWKRGWWRRWSRNQRRLAKSAKEARSSGAKRDAASTVFAVRILVPSGKLVWALTLENFFTGLGVVFYSTLLDLFRTSHLLSINIHRMRERVLLQRSLLGSLDLLREPWERTRRTVRKQRTGMREWLLFWGEVCGSLCVLWGLIRALWGGRLCCKVGRVGRPAGRVWKGALSDVVILCRDMVIQFRIISCAGCGVLTKGRRDRLDGLCRLPQPVSLAD